MFSTRTSDFSVDAFATVFEELYDPAFLVDCEGGQFLASNHAAARLLGYSPDDLATLSPSDIHPHELPRLQRFLQEVMKHGRWQADSLSCRCRDGSFIPAEARATKLQLNGRTCVMIQIRDLRGEQLAEVGQSVRKLAHDLRNALTTAQLLADRLSTNDVEAVRMSANVITRSLDRAIGMCQETVSIGQLTVGSLNRERFLLDDVVEEVIATVVLPSGLGTRVVFDPDNSTLMDADFDKIYRILLNLVRNASEAGAKEVCIGGSRKDSCAELTVRDDGPGLPDFICKNLMREKPELSSGSSGLGLMICCELAESHGGRMDVARSDNTGTEFRITIPDAA